MTVLLTGITGNLGYEVAHDLMRRGVNVIPCIRPRTDASVPLRPGTFPEVVTCDLAEERDIPFSGILDGIVHCAGVVHFRTASNRNERMMRSVISLAQRMKVPLYAVSTAFVYRPPGTSTRFNNDYEEDKFKSEQLLIASGLPATLFRPSVLTGNSRTGAIRNFSGFYFIVQEFLNAIAASQAKDRVVRFPRMTGESNMVPVDQAAQHIGAAVQDGRRGLFYLTNPSPPRSEWVLDEVLTFFGVRDRVTILDLSFAEYGKLKLTEAEAALYRFSSHFSPYWSMQYPFPPSACSSNLIGHGYLTRALTFFSAAARTSHGARTH